MEHDCEKWFPFSKTIILDGKKTSKEAFLRNDFDIAIINFEKTWRNNDLFLINKDFYIIIDESELIGYNKRVCREIILRRLFLHSRKDSVSKVDDVV